MDDDPANGLTDELAASIRAEIESAPVPAERELAAVRAGAGSDVELVAYDEESDEPDVVVTLTREEALALAVALVELGGG